MIKIHNEINGKKVCQFFKAKMKFNKIGKKALCIGTCISMLLMLVSQTAYTVFVNQTPSANDFTFIPPDNPVYDGGKKGARFEFLSDQILKINKVSYSKKNSNWGWEDLGEDLPIDSGIYKVKINVEYKINQGSDDEYDLYKDITSDDWTFTITPANPKYTPPTEEIQATYGKTLSEFTNKLGCPKFKGVDIDGKWTWSNDGEGWSEGYAQPVGYVGCTNSFTAKFTPNPGIVDNFDWSTVKGWNSTDKVIYVYVQFNVEPINTELNLEVTLSKNEFIYNGTEKKPKVTVKCKGIQLEEGIDYTIIWPYDIVNVGTKYFEIVLQNKYSGLYFKSYTIKQTPLADINITANDKIYDGTTDVNIESIKFMSTDGSEITLKEGVDYEVIKANFENENVGENKIVNVEVALKNINFTFFDDIGSCVDYKVSKCSATIEVVPICIFDVKAYNKIYDGTTRVNIIDFIFEGSNGFIYLEKGTDYVVDEANFNDKNVGTNKVLITTVTLLNSNYTFFGINNSLELFSANKNWKIDPKQITVTANDQIKLKGEPDPELTYTVSELVNGDSLNGRLSREVGEGVGTYDITQGSLNNPNYNIRFTKATFEIIECE